ncbi:MAG: hypothetical protein AAGK97_16950, partial [Bacteroidota bacterium]
MKINKITCPHCNDEIEVGHALISELEAHIRKDLKSQFIARMEEDAAEDLKKMRQQLKEQYELKLNMLQEENL